MRNHYVTLGLMQDATEREIVYAYRHLARKLHPDLHPEDPAAAERFGAVQVAYDVLRDPAARARHDAELSALGIVPPNARPAQARAPEPVRPVPWRVPHREPPPPRFRRRWWEPPVYLFAAFLLCGLALISVIGWDAFRGIGLVISSVVFVGAAFVLLISLLREALTRR